MLKNAPFYLYTPTYDGSGQAIHPSVIDFDLESPLQDFVHKPSQDPFGWDNEMIYQSSFTRINLKKYPYYRVWYSARSRLGSWHIGHTTGRVSGIM